MNKDSIMNTYARFDVIFEKGIGCRLYDVNGREYIDFVSGIAVNCLGHSHPVIVKTIAEQAGTLMHISNLYWNTKQLELGEKLVSYSDHDKVFFCNSGAEAVEGALKIAKKYGKIRGGDGKNEIIYMDNSFHGRTIGALSVTGQEKYQKYFRPLLPGTKSVAFNDIEDLKSKVDENTCAILIEPIQGEGGINSASVEFLEEARALCDRYDALLIYDEIQCGIGRTGELFAYKKFGVIPDVICMAKGLGGGFPIGAILANIKAANAFETGDHGTTFGGNPLACSVGTAVLNELVDGGVIDGIEEKSKYLFDKLNVLKGKYDIINELKGMGLLVGVSFKEDTKKIISRCFEKGLLLVGAGKDVIRILPPLNVEKEDIDKALDILESVLKEIC